MTVIDQEKIRLLKRSDIFSCADEKYLIALAEKSVWAQYMPGEIVFDKYDSSDYLYIIKEGSAEIIVFSEDGKQALFNIMTNNECFGEIGFFDQETRSAAVKATSNLQLLSISHHDWKTLTSFMDAQTWQGIIQVLCKRIRRSSSHIEDSSFLNTKNRLSILLYRLAKDGKISDPKAPDILHISQEKLSQMLGLTREMTNKVLMQLAKDDVISIKHKAILIKKIDVLQGFSDENDHDHIKLHYMA